MSSHPFRRAARLLPAAVLIAVLASSCGSAGSPPSSSGGATAQGQTAGASSGAPPASSAAPTSGATALPAPVADSQQAILQTQVSNDIAALDRGVLTYTRVTTLTTGQSLMFSVSVTDIGRVPTGTIPASETAADLGRGVDPLDMPTGAYVSVQVSCTNITCDSRPPSVPPQPVFSVGQAFWWYWQLTAPSRPGRAQITVTAYAYQGTSAQVLAPLPRPLILPLIIRPAKGYRPPPTPVAEGPAASSSGGSSSSLEPVLLTGLFVLLGAVISGTIPLIIKRRKHGGKPEPPADPGGASPPADPGGA
jgi:hypothetical protein